MAILLQKNALETYRGMCLVLTLQRGDLCCFPFSSCAFPGTGRSREDPGGSPRDQEISSESRRFSQDPGDSPGVQGVLPGTRSSAQHLFLPCSSLPASLQAKPRSFPVSQDGGSCCDLSPQGILGFTSSICHGPVGLCHRVPGLCSFLDVSWHPLLAAAHRGG